MMRRLIQADCFDVFPVLQDASVDMILCDLPYGTTQNKWDSELPLEPLWAHYWRIAKPNAAIVLTAQTPFDKVLGASCLPMLRYEWIWEKSKATGHLNAKRQPLKAHENVLVFYKNQPCYNPQMTPGKPYKGRINNSQSAKTNYGDFDAVRNDNDGTRLPRTVQYFKHAHLPVHPTQKPVELCQYLIRTYTNCGDVVLDNCMGSGTTGVAALRCGRGFIGIEKDQKYFEIAESRLAGEGTFLEIAQ